MGREMFNVIEGGAPEIANAPKPEQASESAAAPAAPLSPTDWSNVVFAAGFCQAARAAHRNDRLAG